MLDDLVAEWARRYPPDAAFEGRYRGRFAPSPTGPLHAGSLVAALASWLDARAHGGQWLIRIEDLDQPRCMPGMADSMIEVLTACGMCSDEPIVFQQQRHAAYQRAFEQLRNDGRVYPCGCTRREIADSVVNPREPGRETVYPGTCRPGLRPGRAPRAWRFAVADVQMVFDDRAHGRIAHDLVRSTGDFVLLRADGQWAYQLAVVVDDAAQQISHVVRGADLLDSTPRQMALADCLGLARPVMLHVPVVTSMDGMKLSKQTGATPIDVSSPAQIARAIEQAARHLFG